MTVCKVLLFGLKPCDITSNTNEQTPGTVVQRQHSLIPTLTKTPQDADDLQLDIKPLLTPMNSRSSTTTESSPIRITIRQTPQGRHHICVSQTLLRTHAGHV